MNFIKYTAKILIFSYDSMMLNSKFVLNFISKIVLKTLGFDYQCLNLSKAALSSISLSSGWAMLISSCAL
jgi:hypothetical protein